MPKEYNSHKILVLHLQIISLQIPKVKVNKISVFKIKIKLGNEKWKVKSEKWSLRNLLHLNLNGAIEIK